VDPGTSIGTEAMAWRTVSLVGLSDCLQLSGFAAGGGDDLSAQPAAASPINITITLS
jgi:hypothetical protein